MPNSVGRASELEEWLRAGVSAAERELPGLLDLPPAALRRELAGRTALETAGLLHVLTRLAGQVVDQYPRRAHELTSVAVELPTPDVPEHRAGALARLRGLALMEHARALGALGQDDAARTALAESRSLLAQTPAYHWYLARVDLMEAPLVHDAGDPAAALELVRRAATEFELHHAFELLVEARMLEMWMHWKAGNDLATTGTWKEAADLAEMRRHPTLLARLSQKAGRLRLRSGKAEDVEEAMRLLKHALAIFDREGLDAEAIQTRWNLAEALTARGRLHEAISEFHKLRATLLTVGRANEAAIASTEIVELLLIAGRDAEVPTFAASLPEEFRTRLTQNALEALTFLAARCAGGSVTRDEVAAVRRFFEDLRQRPNAWFSVPS